MSCEVAKKISKKSSKIFVYDLNVTYICVIKLPHMQTITDFIVKNPSGRYTLVSHRDNTEHFVNGASSNLVYSGIQDSKHLTQSDVKKWVGEQITVTDYYGTPLYSATILAKSKRLWDMSKPMGHRLHSQQKSKNWDVYFERFLNKI